MSYDFLNSSSRTDVGLVRSVNQDSILSLPEHGAFCVADGVGGGQGGEVASRMAVESVQKFFNDFTAVQGVDTLKYKSKYLRRTLQQTSREIREYAQDQGYTSCASTMALLLFDSNQPRRAVALHAGDSRIYRLRNGSLTQLTADHSLMAHDGVDESFEVPDHMRSMITRALGIPDELQVEENSIDVEVGDVYLLCSDGLSGMVTEELLLELMQRTATEDLALMVDEMINAAYEGGAKDNVSVMLVRSEPHAAFDAEDGDLPAMADGEEGEEPETSRTDQVVLKDIQEHMERVQAEGESESPEEIALSGARNDKLIGDRALTIFGALFLLLIAAWTYFAMRKQYEEPEEVPQEALIQEEGLPEAPKLPDGFTE